MKRRIIRSFFIGLCLASAFCWWVSQSRGPYVHFATKSQIVVAAFFRNVLVLGVCDIGSPAASFGFHAGIPRVGDAPTWKLGFAAGLSPAIYVCIPFWFLSTISAVLLWLIWRKTRPKPKGGAFPVEITPPKP